jgi:hypothetical protein
MAGCFLDDFETCAILRETRAERVPQVMPAEILYLGVFQGCCPPFFVVSNGEYGVLWGRMYAPLSAVEP